MIAELERRGVVVVQRSICEGPSVGAALPPPQVPVADATPPLALADVDTVLVPEGQAEPEQIAVQPAAKKRKVAHPQWGFLAECYWPLLATFPADAKPTQQPRYTHSYCLRHWWSNAHIKVELKPRPAFKVHFHLAMGLHADGLQHPIVFSYFIADHGVGPAWALATLKVGWRIHTGEM
eukprot:6491573-Amphidinium_carterae.2